MTYRGPYVECFWAHDGSHRVWYRFRCRECDRAGELRDWLSEAEDDGARHEREQHARAVCA